jgi:hypothetical protein
MTYTCGTIYLGQEIQPGVYGMYAIYVGIATRDQAQILRQHLSSQTSSGNWTARLPEGMPWLAPETRKRIPVPSVG